MRRTTNGMRCRTSCLIGLGAIGRIVAEEVGRTHEAKAVRDHGAEVLRADAGIDLMVISTGALADDETHGRLLAAARRGGSRMLLPAGAIAGIDGLVALRAGGLTGVRYTSVKPPAAWRGTLAEELVDLSTLDQPVAFFEGSARDAAQSYPKNANLAATRCAGGTRPRRDPGDTRGRPGQPRATPVESRRTRPRGL